jgi:hypothetical protein
MPQMNRLPAASIRRRLRRGSPRARVDARLPLTTTVPAYARFFLAAVRFTALLAALTAFFAAVVRRGAASPAGRFGGAETMRSLLANVTTWLPSTVKP